MKAIPKRPIQALSFLLAVVMLVAGCGKKPKKGGGGDPPPAEPPPGGNNDGDGAGGTDGSGGHPLFAGGDPRSAAMRSASLNNLRRLMMAMHYAHDVTQSLPIGIYDKSGQKLGLGWRVVLLPYLEQDNLYKQFKLDEPWDSEHNKTLIPLMPKMFAAPGGSGPDGKTYYRVFVGKSAGLNSPSGPGRGGQVAGGGKLTSMRDGTAQTAVIAEAAEPVVWTRPDGLAFELDKPLPKLGGIFGDGFHLAFGDGSVRFFRRTQLDEKTLRAVISANGGEVIELP